MGVLVPLFVFLLFFLFPCLSGPWVGGEFLFRLDLREPTRSTEGLGKHAGVLHRAERWFWQKEEFRGGVAHKCFSLSHTQDKTPRLFGEKHI